MLALIKRMPLSVLVVALIAVPHLISIILRWHDVPLQPGQLIGSADPDPWLRLSVVRDWLQGGSWYSHEVARSNLPYGGISTPWTRPLDLVIAFFVKLQPESVDINTRLIRAAMMIPWTFMTLLMIAMTRAVRTLCQIPSALFLGIALLGSAPLMWNYFSFAYSDHHSMLAACFVFAMAGILHPEQTDKRMAITGLFLGLILWISPETLMLIGMIYLWYGLVWLRGDASATRPLYVLTSTTALAAAAAVMIERPPVAWFTPIYDSISIVYVYILACAAIIAGIMHRLNPKTLQEKLVLVTSITLLLAVSLWYVFPLAYKGPMAEVHPYIFTHFLPNITEAQSLFQKNTVFAIALLVHPVVAVAIIALSLFRRDCFYDRETALKLGYFFGFTLILFLVQVRWSYYSYPLVALVIAPWLGALFSPEHPDAAGKWPAKFVEGLPENRQMMRRLPILALIFALPLLIAAYKPDESTERSRRFETCSNRMRQMIYGGKIEALGSGKPLNLYAHTNYGGEILFWTHHRIVASNYHREGAGIEYVWEADNIKTLPELRSYLAKRNIDAVLICPSTDAPKDSILVALQSGTTNAPWLKRLPYVPYPEEKKSFWDTTPKKKPVEGADPAVFMVIH